MDNDHQFEELCQILCQCLIEIGELISQKLVIEVMKLMKANKNSRRRSLFSRLWNRGILLKKETSQILVQLVKEKETKVREMGMQIEYIANKAKEYDMFLYPEDLQYNFSLIFFAL